MIDTWLETVVFAQFMAALPLASVLVLRGTRRKTEGRDGSAVMLVGGVTLAALLQGLLMILAMVISPSHYSGANHGLPWAFEYGLLAMADIVLLYAGWSGHLPGGRTLAIVAGLLGCVSTGFVFELVHTAAPFGWGCLRPAAPKITIDIVLLHLLGTVFLVGLRARMRVEPGTTPTDL